jgi:hypothetical protein
VESGLRDDAPKRVTTDNAAAVETTRSRVFTRSRSTGRITTPTPPKRVTTPTGIAAAGAELSPEKILVPLPKT